jgi:hypothetical protein
MKMVICLQITTLFWIGGRICPPLNVHGVNDVRQTEIHTAEELVPEPSCFGAVTAIKNMKNYKS